MIGYNSALLMAMMIPERYDALVSRGARYGFSRVVLGVHYPLDVMGSRMVAQRNVAHYMNDPAYRKMFDEARDQLRASLEKECGTSIAECAKSNAQDDPWMSPDIQKFYDFTMTYDLPKVSDDNKEVKVADGAEVLLETALPNLSAEQRRDLMKQTAYEGGHALTGNDEQTFWQRLDLPAAYHAGLQQGASTEHTDANQNAANQDTPIDHTSTEEKREPVAQ